jgi:hypothetical protein
VLTVIAGWYFLAFGVVGAGALGAVLGHEFGQGRTVSVIAGGVSGCVFALAPFGIQTRLFDAMFPPGGAGEK